jgi:NAD-dependent SIR2 family protein deacetylase
MQMMITDWILAHFVYKEIMNSFYKVFKLRKLKVLAAGEEDKESKLIKYTTQPIDYKKWKLPKKDLDRVKHVIVSKGEYKISETSNGEWIIEKNHLINCLDEGAEDTFLYYLLDFNTIA